MKKIQILAVFLLLVGVAVFTSGCGEKAAEKAIETSAGGQVKVDIDNDKVTVNTNAGSMEVGEGVSLPSGFPSDVHVVDGTITSAVTHTENSGYTISVETSKSVSQVREEYNSQLINNGWDITMSLDIHDGSSLAAEKNGRNVSVSISETEGQTFVVIGTSANE